MHGRCDTVSRVDDRGAFRNFGLLVDEDRTAGLEVAHDMDVVTICLRTYTGAP